MAEEGCIGSYGENVGGCRMIYLKRIGIMDFVGLNLLMIVGVFNIYWMQMTLIEEKITASIFGMNLATFAGHLFIWWVLSRVIGFKKKEVKTNDKE